MNALDWFVLLGTMIGIAAYLQEQQLALRLAVISKMVTLLQVK
jgi:hypothetical protein